MDFESSSTKIASTASLSSDNQTMPSPPAKRKRNLPGMPDPGAEVIALSPKTLMATNRFVCEICGKGFQRDQNLQLHRRGHNLPWKLRQRATNEVVRKRVYVCPEETCVHHEPGRALGDLTGIKKHFSRKHGDKKWKCDRCSKKYAVQSDWKAHSKTCGSREYKCDCGTFFSRRDSFIKHRAFCEALAEESAGAHTAAAPDSMTVEINTTTTVASPPPTATVVSPALSANQSSELLENQIEFPAPPFHGGPTCLPTATAGVESNSVFANMCASTPASYAAAESTSLSLYLSSGRASSIFQSTADDKHDRHYAPSPQPAISATALLQKAAQMGAAASNASLLRGFGLAMPSSSPRQHGNQNNDVAEQWSGGLMNHSSPYSDFAMGPGDPPATVDFLGLGPSTGGFSALLSSLGVAAGGGRGRSNSPEKKSK